MKTLASILVFFALYTATNYLLAVGPGNPDTNASMMDRSGLIYSGHRNLDGDITTTAPVNPAGLPNNNVNTVPVMEEKDFTYLKFDVDKYYSEEGQMIEELPVNDFDYLRFDVNTFIEQNPVGLEELPNSEFERFKFDVNRFIILDPPSDEDLGELPSAQ